MTTEVPGGVTYAADTFTRSVTDHWNSAEAGGAYSLSGTAADFDVAGGSGTIALRSAGTTRTSMLASVAATDVDARVRVRSNKAVTGSGQYAYLVLRQVNSSTEYRAKLRLAADGGVWLQANRVVGGVESGLGSEVRVSGLVHSADNWIRLRAQVVGTNPTTIRLKAWADGQSEPASWAYSTTNAEPSLQGAGAVGVRAYISSSTSNAPVLVSFDDFLITSPVGTATPTNTPAANTPTNTATPSVTPTNTATATNTPMPNTPTLTNTPTTNTPTATMVPGGVTYAADTFTRSVTDHWNSADTGGTYSLSGTAADFDVAGGSGTINLRSAGTTRTSMLASVAATDVDARVRIRSNKAVTGSGQYAYLVLRQVNSSTEYRAKLRLAADGGVWLQANRVVGGVESGLGSEVSVSGLVHSADNWIRLRAQVVGSSPTTIRLKAWADGQSEPASWAYSTTNAEPSLQGAGAVGVRAYISSSTSNAPVLVSFDDFLVAAISE